MAIPPPKPSRRPLSLAPPETPAPAERCYWVVPGRLLAGAYPESLKPEERGKRVTALWRAGIRTFVNLVEDFEVSTTGAPFIPYQPTVEALARAEGERVRCVREPIPDFSITTDEGMRTILDIIDRSIEGDHPVYVHCISGMGRTGTVVGCWLLRHGLATSDDVLAVLAELRRADHERAGSPSPEGPSQVRMVLGWQG